MALPSTFSYYDKDDIDLIFKSGSVNTRTDSFGNYVMNSDFNKLNVSESIVSIPLMTYEYKPYELSTTFDFEFREFINDEITPTIALTIQSEELRQTELKLEEVSKQLELLIAEKNNTDRSKAEQMAVKSTIIQLRKTLKEGTDDIDFSTEFPYLPLTK